MTELTSIAFVRALPGKTLALGRELCILAGPARSEAGCISYEVHQSNDDPDIWFIYESWCAAEDQDAHYDTPHFRDFAAKAEALVDGELALHRFMRYSAGRTLELSASAA